MPALLLLLAVYYVAPSGNDASPGTSAAPWRTCQKALNTIAPGDTAIMRPGAYVGCGTDKSGTPGSPKTLLGEPGAVIDRPPPTNPHRSMIELEDCDNGITDWVIEGLTFKSINSADGYPTALNGIDVRCGKRITIRRNTFDNIRFVSIFTAAVESEVVDQNTIGLSYEHGIYKSNSCDGGSYTNNRINGPWSSGIQVNADQAGPSGLCAQDGLIYGVKIQGNTILNVGQRGGAAVNLDGCQNCTVDYNTIEGARAGGVALYAEDGAKPTSNTLVRRNRIRVTGGRDPIENAGGTGNLLLENDTGSGPAPPPPPPPPPPDDPVDPPPPPPPPPPPSTGGLMSFTEVSETQSGLLAMLTQCRDQNPAQFIPWSVVSADWDANGRADLAVSSHIIPGNTCFFKQTPTGTWLWAQPDTGYPSLQMPAGDNAPDVDIDFDGDGKADLGAHSFGGRDIFSFRYLGPTPPWFSIQKLWEGGGTQWYNPGFKPWSRDGNGSRVYSYFIQNRNSPFGERRDKKWNGSGFTASTAQLAAPSRLPASVLATLTAAKASCVTPGYQVRVFEDVDINGDGIKDMYGAGNAEYGADANPLCYASFALICPAAGLCGTPVVGFPASGTPIYWLDANGDGRLDPIIANGPAPGLYLQGVDGTMNRLIDPSGFMQGTNFYRAMPTKTELRDLNGDGRLDFISKVWNGEVGVWQNNGDGTFARVLGPLYCWRSDPVFIADVNADGKLDLIGGGCPNGGNLQLKLYLQN